MTSTRMMRVVLLGCLAAPAFSQGAALAQPSGDPFDAAYERLRRGPAHTADAPTGLIESTRTGADGRLYRYVLIVPEDYDPARGYPVAFYLHGGVARPDPGPGGRWWRRYENVTGHDRIAVLPLAWNESMWWQASQVENLRAILSDVKRAYNVDENRVHLFGVSDGGTGVYFLAFKDPTPWAAFLPFIGHPAVLLNPQSGADGLMNLANLTNRSFFIVNGETDPLYPVRVIRPHLQTFEQVGVDFVFTPKPGGHDTRWWPEEEENIERFVEEHPRDPHPERVVWATERADRYNRAHWLVIEELGRVPGDEERGPRDPPPPGTASGIADAVRAGNEITVDTYYVRRFTLLISPDAFDLERPIRVRANGSVVFEGVVRPDVATLEKWAAVDEDRTMLYAAEVPIDLGSRQTR